MKISRWKFWHCRRFQIHQGKISVMAWWTCSWRDGLSHSRSENVRRGKHLQKKSQHSSLVVRLTWLLCRTIEPLGHTWTNSKCEETPHGLVAHFPVNEVIEFMCGSQKRRSSWSSGRVLMQKTRLTVPTCLSACSPSAKTLKWETFVEDDEQCDDKNTAFNSHVPHEMSDLGSV